MPSSERLLQKLRAALEHALGQPAEIIRVQQTGGGCINFAVLVEIDSGERFFVKWHPHAPPDMYLREAECLDLMRRVTSLRVPKPLWACNADEAGPAFLVLEDISVPSAEASRARPQRSPHFDETLAHGLATMHRHTAEAYGFYHDNYIGSTPQPNPWTASWVEFFRQHRLEHMIRLLVEQGRLEKAHLRDATRFLDRLELYLDAAGSQPALLHGDLWAGNVMADGDGTPAIIDPACYFGDREADLAMTYLFGGFSQQFYDAYDEAFPLHPAFAERRDIYNLYHLLNHAYLFGGGYLRQALAIIRRYA